MGTKVISGVLVVCQCGHQRMIIRPYLKELWARVSEEILPLMTSSSWMENVHQQVRHSY